MLSEEFYTKIGRMTVAFGELDFNVGQLARVMAEVLGQDLKSKFTQQRLGIVEDWAKRYADDLRDELSQDLVTFSKDAVQVLRLRPDGAHGLWVQDDHESLPWAMVILPGEAPVGVRSTTDEVTVERLTWEAIALNKRATPLTVRFIKRMNTARWERAGGRIRA